MNHGNYLISQLFKKTHKMRENQTKEIIIIITILFHPSKPFILSINSTQSDIHFEVFHWLIYFWTFHKKKEKKKIQF